MYKKFTLVLIILFALFFNLEAKSLESILKKGYITVAVKYNSKPLGFINKDGHLDGFEIDLINNIADRLNVRVKFIELYNNKNRLFSNNSVDLIVISLFDDLSNNSNIILSDAYFYDLEVLLSKKSLNFNNLKDFEDKRVGVIRESLNSDFLLHKVPKIKIVPFSDHLQLIKALNSNNLDAISIDSFLANDLILNSKNKYKIINLENKKHSYNIIANKEKSELILKINSLLKDMQNDGSYDIIYNKWLKNI